jgi:hypothetical protein
MKKGVLLLLGMFIMVSTVEANNSNKLSTIKGNYLYNNSVNFTELGIEFFIFTNGDFDFNTYDNDFYKDHNGRRIKNNRDVRIDRNYKGQITKIGNAFINYDYRGNVTRIGNISLSYRFGKLTNVGDLRVQYDRWGNPNFYGNVRNYYYDNGIRFSLNFGDVCNYNDTYFYRNDFKNNYRQFREDRNYYYYKARPNAKIGKRSKILRRRKLVTKIDNRRVIKRNSNNSYRKPSINSKNRNSTAINRNSNKSNNRPSIIINKNVKTLKKRNNTSSSSRKPITVKRNTRETTKQKVATKGRTVRSKRS